MKIQKITVDFQAAHILGITPTQYMICALTQAVQTDPSAGGWCNLSRKEMGEYIGKTGRTVTAQIRELQEQNLLECNEEGNTRITQKWYDATQSFTPSTPEKISGGVKKFQGGGEKISGVTDQSQKTIPYRVNTTMVNSTVIGGAETKKNIYPDKKMAEKEFVRLAIENGKRIDAEDMAGAFVDYWEARDWKSGKTPIKNWRASASTWFRNHFKFQAQREKSQPKSAAQRQNELNDYVNKFH